MMERTIRVDVRLYASVIGLCVAALLISLLLWCSALPAPTVRADDFGDHYNQLV